MTSNMLSDEYTVEGQQMMNKRVADGYGAQTQRGKLSLRLLLLLLVPLLVVLVSGFIYVTGGRYVETENAYVHNDKISIIPEVSGNVDAVYVHENQHVQRGELLFQIEAKPYQIKVAQAQSALAKVSTDIETLKASYAEQQQKLVLAHANQDYAAREYQRQQELAASQSVSASVLDKYQHQLEVAKEDVHAVEQGLRRIKASLAGDPNIDVRQHPSYQQAQASLAQAQRDLAQTRVVAEFAGSASKTPTAGQYVDPRNPAMMLVADKQAWVEANLKETQLTYVRMGQPVQLHVDAYPDQVWQGYVKSIAPATGSEYAILPAQNATGNWVKVVQRVPIRIAVEARGDAPALRAGMSVEISIDTGWHHRGPDFLQPLVALLQNSVNDQPVHLTDVSQLNHDTAKTATTVLTPSQGEDG